MLRLVDLLHQRLLEDVVDECRLPRPGDTRDSDERPERKRDVDVLQVVLAGTLHHEQLTGARSPHLGHGDAPPAAQVLTGYGVGRLEQAFHGPVVDDGPAVLAGPWA